ncbi:TonB-dependent receptor [Thauera sp. SDU_THAU2]|uniref:TonB-dependent receptor n=1 Tax=Thauera sp. SDU_THAU2 TaxID=3136633 RepID=UPI00311E9720
MPGVAQVRKHPPSSRRFSSHGRRNLRLNATLLCILAAFLAPESSQAQTAGTTQQQGVRSYDIGPGPLAEVLNRFAREAGVLLSFDAQALQGRHSSGVQGSHAVGEGFRQLLAGSGLQAVAIAANRYVLRPLLPDIAGEDDPARNATEMKSVLVTGERTKDEVGHDNVYEKDISNAYVDRQYMERYRGVSVGDVFAGVNGVYNSDNRNGAALYPNIRGLSGNGRIPVTVDGTVQSIDVWMGRQGINNRNYVDPNLFRSIEVEKGPSMTRGLKSGIGGAVNIRTIDADDIVEDGRNWGRKSSWAPPAIPSRIPPTRTAWSARITATSTVQSPRGRSMSPACCSWSRRPGGAAAATPVCSTWMTAGCSSPGPTGTKSSMCWRPTATPGAATTSRARKGLVTTCRTNAPTPPSSTTPRACTPTSPACSRPVGRCPIPVPNWKACC